MAADPLDTCAARVDRLLAPIFEEFLDIQRRRQEELETALAAADFATLERLGHAIKGGAATYQLPDAAALGASLEIAAINGDAQGCARNIAALRRYFAHLAVQFV